MDPVQLMMAAHQADATVAAQTPDQALQAAIAQSRPDLWAPLSTNPAAYPDLLGWLASTGNVEVLANLRARGYLTDDAAANAADSAGAVAADADGSGEAGDEQDTDEPAEDSNAAETAAEPDADPEDAAGEAQEPRPDDSGDEAEDGAEDAGSGEAGVEPETEEPAEDSEDSEDVEGDEAESPDSEDPHVEDAAVDEAADEHGVESAEAAEEPGTEEPAEDSEDSDEAETAVDPGAETATDEAADSGNNDTTVLATASQRHEVDSADTTDFTASAQSAAVTSGWTAGSAAPAAGSAESVAFPVPPPPSAEDIAAWAETPSGAPSGFSAAQPAVELDMFGPQMMAQMPPPQQQRQPSRSSSGRLIAIIVVLLLVIVGGGGLWAGSHFANKDKSEDTSQNKADSDGGEDGKQNGQADAAATSTAAALPSGAVKACSSMPTFTITSVEDGQGELKVHGNMATSCAEGDFLAGSSSQVLVYSSTSPTGGADVDHLVASGTFDLSSDPLIIPNGGRAVTLRFGEQHYFRTAKDLDLKGLTVRPSFDRGSSSTATAKSSTNSAMTIASSASSNANQEAQDEQAAGDAIGWQVKHDYPIVMNSMRGKWTPQLSSKQVGLVAEGQTWTNRSILAEFLKTRQANPKAVIIDTSQWPVYDVGGWWVTLSGELYDDADQANAWCDAQGYDSDHCLAKRIESNGTSQGTTKLR